MKKTFPTFRDTNRLYRTLRQAARPLFVQAGGALAALLVLCKCFTRVVFIPLMQLVWALTLRFAPIHYLRNNNASDVFTSPSILAGLALIAVLTACWIFFGFSLLIHGLDQARQRKPLRPGELLGWALADLGQAARPRNWGILLYCAALIPFTDFFLASNYLTQFAVPDYLLGVFRANARYHLLYLALGLLAAGLLLAAVLVLPLFILEHKDLGPALRESIGFVRQQTIPVACVVVRWTLAAALRTGLLALAVLLPLYGLILGLGTESTRAMVALARACLLIQVPFFRFLMDFALTLALALVVVLLHCQLRGTLQPEPLSPRWHRGRKLLAAAAAGATLLTLGLSVVYGVLPREDQLRTMLGGTNTIVTAHRGVSSAAPENTLPAFALAVELGSQRAELDVQMTRDGVVMVTHDTSLRRCTGHNANIYDLTYDQVRQLDAGRWFGPAYTGTQIPTLEEVLDLCKGRLQLNVEIKPNAATPELEAETVRILREKGFASDCVITSQSYETLCKVKELAPEIPTGYILALGVGTYYDLPAADFFSVESSFITSGMVQQIHLRGKTISAWTVNREEEAREMLSLGVDDVITDKPAMVQALLQEDADADDPLLRLRDQLFRWFRGAEDTQAQPDPDESAVQEALEDPDQLLDQA